MRIAVAMAGLILATAPGAALAQLPGAVTTRPIPDDGAWTIATVANGGCFARNPGAQVDTIVMVNAQSKLVVSGGHRDWDLGETAIQVALQVDGGVKHPMTVHPIGPIFLVVIDDPAIASQVEGAHTLTWTLPNGVVTGEVTGLDKAFQVATACGLAAAKAAAQ